MHYIAEIILFGGIEDVIYTDSKEVCSARTTNILIINNLLYIKSTNPGIGKSSIFSCLPPIVSKRR